MQIPKEIEEYLQGKANIEDIIDEMKAAKSDKRLLFLAHKLIARNEAVNYLTFDLFKIIKDANNR